MTCLVFLWACLKLRLLCVEVQKSSAVCDKLGRGQRLLPCLSEASLSLDLLLVHAEMRHHG